MKASVRLLNKKLNVIETREVDLTDSIMTTLVRVEGPTIRVFGFVGWRGRGEAAVREYMEIDYARTSGCLADEVQASSQEGVA